MHNEEKSSAPQRKHGPNRGTPEKPKNFSVTLKKMFKYLHNFLPLILIALVLSATSSILAIIGPDKISDLTNEISNGLVVKQDKLKDVSNDIMKSLNSENFKSVSGKVLNFKLDGETISTINVSSNISNEDKTLFNESLQSIKTNQSNTFEILSNLPLSIKKVLLKDETIDGVKVSFDDKIKYLKLSSNMPKNQEGMLKMINNVPLSIQKLLFKTSTIDGVKITTLDKVKFLKQMGKLDKKSSVTTIYKAIDASPKSIRNLVKPVINIRKVKKIMEFLLTIYLISAFFNFVQSFIMASVSNNFAKNLRTKISVKINKLPLRYFDRNTSGDILSRVTNDIDTIGTSLYQSLGTLVGALTLFLGSIIMMFVTNWVMAVTAILSSLLGFSFMAVVLSKSQKYFDKRQTELGKLNGHIEEIYSSHNIVKAYNGNKDASKKFDKLNGNVFECDFKSQFLSGLTPSMMGFVGNLGYVAVCVVGALLVVKGKINFGTIMAFIIYVRLFTNPLSQIAQGFSTLQSTIAAGERVFEFIEEKEMEKDAAKTRLLVSKVKGLINFNHVKFGYDDKLVIKDFNCEVKKGQKVAIVGPTGAGKTTMVNLLMRFYDIKNGDITIDGVSIKDLTRENIHDLFIMVLQDTWLFNGTIRDNIKYNTKNVSDKEINDALKIVGIDHFVKSLPDNLDYEIKDNESISAGQKQLLTIARGMIKNAPFLILDEATSSVDTRTEELVQKAMDKLTEGRTSFIIAHRLSTIKNADIILVMKDGNIVEQGNHQQLLKKKGFYAELYNSQFQD